MHLMYGVCHELQLLQKHRAGCSLSLKIPLYKKKKKKRQRERERGKSLLSLPLINKKLVYLIFCMCLCLEALWKSSRQLQLAAYAHPTAGQLARQLQEDYYMHL